jgi:hypothetical protein
MLGRCVCRGAPLGVEQLLRIRTGRVVYSGAIEARLDSSGEGLRSRNRFCQMAKFGAGKIFAGHKFLASRWKPSSYGCACLAPAMSVEENVYL